MCNGDALGTISDPGQFSLFFLFPVYETCSQITDDGENESAAATKGDFQVPFYDSLVIHIFFVFPGTNFSMGYGYPGLRTLTENLYLKV